MRLYLSSVWNKNCDRHSEQKLSFQFGVELFNQDIGPDYVSLLSKLEGLKSLDSEDFFSFRRMIFDCLNLMNKVSEYVKSR